MVRVVDNGTNFRLRILMLIPDLGFGGAEGSFLRLARYLAAVTDVSIAVLGRPYAENFNSVADLPNLTVRQLDDGGVVGSGLFSKARRWWRLLRGLRLLKRQHDVTISFLSGMNLLNAVSGSRARTIVSERGSKRHDIGMTRRQRLIWSRFLDPLIYWRSWRIVTASEGLAYEIVTANPWAASRVLAIEGAVAASTLVDAVDLPIEGELQSLAEYETVVAFGRLHVQKGYDFLLSTFAIVRAERPRARLLLLGSGSEEGNLRLLAKKIGLTVGSTGELADVILPGLREHPLRYLRLGKVFALPSRFEGLPNALIEALAAGLPVLASDCPWGPRSILSSGHLSYTLKTLTLPAPLSHGVLLPLPETPGAIQIWAAEIARVLAAPTPTRPDRATRLAAIASYDIAKTGLRWLDLAYRVAQNAGRR